MIVSCEKRDGQLQIAGKVIEGSGRDLLEGIVLTFVWCTSGEPLT